MRGRWLRAVMAGLGVLASLGVGGDDSPSVVVAYPRKCAQGLYRQPGGAFAAILFCDDAAGSSLGVVCYSGSVCAQSPWQLSSRFWQEERWARDVTAFGWDPDGTCLYISTSEIYGQGDVYALDLPKQKATPIPIKVQGVVAPRTRPSTQVMRINQPKRLLEYRVDYADAVTGSPRSEVASIPLGRCGQM
jgi:hypothetical protein